MLEMSKQELQTLIGFAAKNATLHKKINQA